MYTVVQKWGNSHGIRLPKLLLEELGIHENDRLEIISSHDAITIKKTVPPSHKSLEDRLTAFYGKPLEDIEPPETQLEVDWGKTEGSEVW